MSNSVYPHFKSRFENALQVIRDKVTRLPPHEREHFVALADQAERDCREVQRCCAAASNAFDDLSLTATAAKFSLSVHLQRIEAMRRVARKLGDPREASS